MMRVLSSAFLLFVVVFAAACGKTDNTMLPVGGGGGGDGGLRPDSSPFTGDAATPDGTLGDGGAATLTGRVCLAADPRMLTMLVSPTACASTGADGLTVTLGDQTATTAADGTFTIQMPSGAGSLVFHVTGPNIVPSHMILSDYEIPALTTATFEALEAANGVTLLPGEGSIFAQIIRNGAGYTGVVAGSTPTSNYDAFYDGASATAWTQTGTGNYGAVWLPGLDVGDSAATVKATDSEATPVSITTAAQPIYNGGITFIDIVYP